MSGPTADVAPIPVVDARSGGLVRHASEDQLRARALSEECIRWLPAAMQVLLPALDAATRGWLRRSSSPYLEEVEAIAKSLGFPGIWFLNGSYEWGCTALARDEDGGPWLARTLDWPFPGLGRHVEVVRMQGEAGDFLNVTWPGYVGTLTALAPRRFAAAINQAPLWRRTRKPWLRPVDIVLNALRTWGIHACPPDHLLRQVFETCRSFGEAKQRLEATPVARPAIFTLVGCEPGERCVIERTEQDSITRVEETSSANDWLHSTPPWEARVSSAVMLTRTYEEAAANSRLRRETLAAWPESFARPGFAWVRPPVLNPFTRIAVEMCPANATLRVAGYENEAPNDVPQQVTLLRELSAALT